MSRYYGKPYYKVLRVNQEPDDWFWVKNEESSQGNFSITYINNTPSTHPQWSTDLTTWHYFSSWNQIEVPAGGKIYFRSMDGWNEYDKYWVINEGGNQYSIGGNLATLVNWQNKDTVSRFPNYFLNNFLNDKTLLVDASTLTTGNVTTAGIYSFQDIFNGATNLTAIGDFSSLTTLEYGAFDSALRESGLTTGLDLSNVTTVGNYALNYMYAGCADLETVTAPNVSTWNTDKTTNWLWNTGGNVSGTKTAYVPDGVTIPELNSGIPSGWTRVTY